MAKQMPKAMQKKLERVDRLMSQIIDLNQDIERWLEASGITEDGFDYTSDFRECPGYWIADREGFIAKVNQDLEEA